MIDTQSVESEDKNATRKWKLPLKEHPVLSIASDFVALEIVPLDDDADEPFLEARGRSVHVEVHASGGTTRVDVGVRHRREDRHDHSHEHWWEGPWWAAEFWENRKGRRSGPVHLVAHVPARVVARVRSSAARIHVAGLRECDLSIKADAGAISLEDVHGKLHLATDAGRIDATHVGGSLDVATTAGAVRLEVVDLAPGKHRVRTNVGSVRVELARDLPVAIFANTTMGSTHVRFPSEPGAAAELHLEADLGSVRVTPADSVWVRPVSGGDVVAEESADVTYRSHPARGAKTDAHVVDAQVEAILRRVADGTLDPKDARTLLKALGYA